MKRIALSSALLLAFSSGCGSAVSPPAPASNAPAGRAAAAARIQNVIVVVQDARTFDNLFAGFPGAYAPTYGTITSGARVPLRATTFHRSFGCGIPSGAQSFFIAWNSGKMNGFDRLDRTKPLCPYTQVALSETTVLGAGQAVYDCRPHVCLDLLGRLCESSVSRRRDHARRQG